MLLLTQRNQLLHWIQAEPEQWTGWGGWSEAYTMGPCWIYSLWQCVILLLCLSVMSDWITARRAKITLDLHFNMSFQWEPLLHNPNIINTWSKSSKKEIKWKSLLDNAARLGQMGVILCGIQIPIRQGSNPGRQGMRRSTWSRVDGRSNDNSDDIESPSNKKPALWPSSSWDWSTRSSTPANHTIR